MARAGKPCVPASTSCPHFLQQTTQDLGKASVRMPLTIGEEKENIKRRSICPDVETFGSGKHRIGVPHKPKPGLYGAPVYFWLWIQLLVRASSMSSGKTPPFS